MSKIIISENIDDDNEYRHHTEYDDLYTRFKDYEVEAFIDGDKYLYVYRGRKVKSQLSKVLINQILEFTTPIIQSYTQFDQKKSTVDRENNLLSMTNSNRLEGYVNNIRVGIPSNTKFILEKVLIHKNYVRSTNYHNNINYNIEPLPKLYIPESIINLSENTTHDELVNIYNNNILKYLNFYNDNNAILTNYFTAYSIPTEITRYIPKSIVQSNELVSKLFKFINENDEFYFSDAIYTKLKNLDLHELYEKIDIDGFNEDVFAHYKILKQEQINKLNTNRIIEHNTLKYYKLRYVAISKFPNLFNVNHKENKFSDTIQFNIKSLSKQQLDIILIEYAKTEEYIKNYITNTCSHIPALAKFRKEINLSKKLELFENLKEYLDYYPDKSGSVLGDEYIKGKLCGLNVLCPHVYEYYDMLSNSENDYDTQRSIIKKYSSKDQVEYTYTCRICSEEIGKSEDLEKFVMFVKDKQTNTSVDMNELRLKIIKFVYQLTNSYIDISRVIINTKVLVFNIVDAVYSYIDVIRIKLEKSRTSSDEEIEAKMNVFIIVVIISYYINIMNSVDISFKSATTKQHILGGLVNNATKLKTNMILGFDIVMSQKYYIKQAKMSNNVLRDVLIQYYKKIANIINPLEATDSNVDILELLKISRVYNYIIEFNNLYPLVTDKYTYNDYMYLLHKDVLKVQNVSIYTNIKLPPFSLNKKSVDVTNLLNKNEFQYASGIQTFKYLMENIFKFTPFPVQYDKFYTDETIKSINEYNEYTTHLLKYEEQLVSDNVKYYLKPYTQLTFKNSRHYVPHVKNLNTFWDVNGVRHKFKKFIYSETDITTMAKIGIRPKDIACVICDQRVGDIKIDSEVNKRIKFNLVNDSYIKSFFRYFTFKCPVELFHTFKDGKCIYCKVDQSQLIKHDLTYFKKYENKYKEINNIKRSAKQSAITDLKLFTKFSDDYKDYVKNDLSLNLSNELNSSKLTLLAFTFDIKEETFLKLGLEVGDSVKTRYYKLYNYFNVIVILYNMLKYSHRILKIADTDLYKFIHNLKINNTDLTIFTKLKDLPILPINIDYNTTIAKDNMDIVILNAIIENLLFISSQNKLSPHIKAFIKLIIDKVIKADLLYTPYDRFKKDLIIEGNLNSKQTREHVNYNDDLEDDEIDIFSSNAYDFDDDVDGDNLNGEY